MRLKLTGSGGTAMSMKIQRSEASKKPTAFLLGLLAQLGVLLYTFQEILSALGMPDVLHTQVDALLNVAVTNDLLDNHSDGTRGNVVDNSCPAT